MCGGNFLNFRDYASPACDGLAEKDYFRPEERVELAHVFSWMLGCTEYGQLSSQSWEIGYYDRIGDENHACLKPEFKKM